MLSEADYAPFKASITTKLEKISDADAETLAEYVLELLKSEGTEQQLRELCLSQLVDFVGDNTRQFVDETFAAIKNKTFDPKKPPARPAAPVYQPPRRQSLDPNLPNPGRKRAHRDWDLSSPNNAQSYGGRYRPVKQSRRGRASNGYSATQSGLPFDYTQPLHPPTPPPGMPPFDPNDPMSTFLAVHRAMGFPAWPGMPTLPANPSLPMPGPGYGQPKGTGHRCRDYDVKGFCTRGVACPFEHGGNPYVVPTLPASDEYDPNNPAASLLPTPTRTGRSETSFPFDSPALRVGPSGRARGRGGYRGGKERAPFSHIGNLNDPSATTIVVEGIPEENFDGQAVRSFFSDFGDVREVTMQPYKRLAIVDFSSHDAADAAYNSPKSVFDNRFVKVYWYRPERPPKPTKSRAGVSAEQARRDVDMGGTAEPEPDMWEVARRQEEAQRKHDELKRQREEAEHQRRELDEKLRAMDFDRKQIAAKLAQLSSKNSASTLDTATPAEDAKTMALKEQLAKLEAEATSIGINPDPFAPEPTNGHAGFPTPRGRAGYRGRGTPRGRSHFAPSYRGGHTWAAGPKVKRLDNRPKTVSLTVPEGEYRDGRADAHPERTDTALITFSQRFEGENFIAAALGQQGPLKALGRVELGWFSGALPSNGHVPDGDVPMGGVDPQQVRTERSAVDMDTYDENEDHWG
ncbi:PWI domain [Teratosphaeria destructans]|uniref:PWI domain n=1 Tax=Teratosphaeria destructans TaxID=418781 RepID=A0A9W7W0Z6_9PEZI|nr:PWI domain [Teratosphaeria destructans]